MFKKTKIKTKSIRINKKSKVNLDNIRSIMFIIITLVVLGTIFQVDVFYGALIYVSYIAINVIFKLDKYSLANPILLIACFAYFLYGLFTLNLSVSGGGFVNLDSDYRPGDISNNPYLKNSSFDPRDYKIKN